MGRSRTVSTVDNERGLMKGLRYLDFELKIEREGERYMARVLRSPVGEAANAFTLPFSDERLELLMLKLGRLRGSTRRSHSVETEAARELGGKLFEAAFGGEVRACLRSSLDEAYAQEGTGLRLKLRLQEVAELADLPWEFLFDPSFERFLAQSNQTPIVRYLEMPERIRPLTVSLPLRVLVMISSPSDYARLDVERERSMLQEALASLSKEAKVEVEWLENATLAALQRCLREGTYHVFHFIGHGGFDTKAEEGVLVLEDEQGRAWQAGAHRLGTLLHDHRSLRLAVLNACEGARNSRTDPFAGVATSLIRQGIPAVAAMQFEITDDAAITFAAEFYAALVNGFPVDAAMAEARKAIYSRPNDIEWGTPVLYTRAPDGVLFNVTGAERQTAPSAPPPPERKVTSPAPPLERKATSAPPPRGKGNLEEQRALVQPSTPPKNPLSAAVICFFLTGMGQVYLGQRKKGFMLLGAGILLTIFDLASEESAFWGVLAVILWGLTIIDAYRIGAKLKGGQLVEPMEFFWKT